VKAHFEKSWKGYFRELPNFPKLTRKRLEVLEVLPKPRKPHRKRHFRIMMSGGSTSRQLRKLSRKLCLELIRRHWKWKVGRKSLSVKSLKLAQEGGSIKPLLLTLIT
jgi:hypothetical protein